MRKFLLLLAMLWSAAVALSATGRNDFFSSFRISPVLTDSCENTILRSNSASVFYLDSVSDGSGRSVLGYGYKIRKTVRHNRYDRLASYLLSKDSFIRSDFSVMAPFVPQAAVKIGHGHSSVTFLFSFRSSTVRIFSDDRLTDELLLADPHAVMSLFKLFMQ